MTPAEKVGMTSRRRPVARAIHRIPVRVWITATVPATAPAARNAWRRFRR
jgi:predicted acetyltransferase